MTLVRENGFLAAGIKAFFCVLQHSFSRPCPPTRRTAPKPAATTPARPPSRPARTNAIDLRRCTADRRGRDDDRRGDENRDRRGNGDRDRRGDREGKRANCDTYSRIAEVQVDANDKYAAVIAVANGAPASARISNGA